MTLFSALLIPGIKTLRLAHFHTDRHGEIVRILSHKSCQGLESLDLRGVWLGGEERMAFSSLVARMYNLTKLVFPYVADDDIIRIIGR